MDEWPGHIACDAESKSEMVVPIIVQSEVVAIIDIDCAATDGFDALDEARVEEMSKLLAEGCDWGWKGGRVSGTPCSWSGNAGGPRFGAFLCFLGDILF